jgi:probable rRNA maturation factor
MKIVVSLQIEPRRKSLDASALTRFAEAALRWVKPSRGKSGAGVGILVTRSAELQRLNRRFRGKNKPTDVLSFPAATLDGQEKYPFVHMGDIAISADIAAENARRLGHSVEDEIKILILHGVLHLSGHDHEHDNGQMAALETKLRRKLQLPASLIERTTERPPSGGSNTAKTPRKAGKA